MNIAETPHRKACVCVACCDRRGGKRAADIKPMGRVQKALLWGPSAETKAAVRSVERKGNVVTSILCPLYLPVALLRRRGK